MQPELPKRSYKLDDKWYIYKTHFIKSGCHRLLFGTKWIFSSCSCQKSWPNELIPESKLFSAIDSRPACTSSFTLIEGSLSNGSLDGSLDGSLVNGCCVGCSWISVAGIFSLLFYVKVHVGFF